MKKLYMVLCFFITSCGTSNLNKIFGSKDNSYSNLLEKAQLAYDLGEFTEAETLALDAYQSTYNNGEAGILLGNIYLGLAGVDIFQLIKKLSEISAPSKKTSTASSTSACAPSTSGVTSSVNTLSELSCKLLNLSSSDIEALGSNVTTSTSTRYSGLSSLGVSTVYVPSLITEEVRGKVSVLKALNQGIKVLCPFIDRSQVLDKSSDSRHKGELCPDKTKLNLSPAKAHITFALINLVETLVMQRGILVDGISSASTASPTGINSVNSKITSSSLSISSFATAASSYINLVADIFAISDTSSQISLALNGLQMVTSSFTVAGVPGSVTKSLDTQLSNLKSVSSKLGVSQTAALQGQMNEKYAKELASKINSQCPSGATGSCSGATQTSVCNSYCSISSGIDPSKASKPTLCASYTCQ